MKPINVLSLCDGMSCGQIALKELNIPVDKYYSSEIDKNAIKVTQLNFPETIQLGDVLNLNSELLFTLPEIDLVMFGSPCRSLSKITIDRKEYNQGLKGVSGLFYNCNNILQWIKFNNNPNVKFLIENVDSNKKEDVNIISELLGVKPILIDSGRFSAQTRLRFYWTNLYKGKYWSDLTVNFILPTNSLVLKDILDSKVPEKYYYNKNYEFLGEDKRVCAILDINTHEMLRRVYNINFKCPTLTACRGGYKQKAIYEPDTKRIRKLTPNEYRKLQTIPDWYKMDLADSHIYNMCGDGWTIEVIKWILEDLKDLKNLKE